MTTVFRSSLSRALAALLLAVGGASCAQDRPAAESPQLGLMGTVPIYWGEAAEFGSVLNGQESGHWARAQLEERYSLVPLDTLDQASLAPLDYLLLAQPRALAPAENVALDAWVRQGGRLLLFADPLMTGESRFSVGDRRRPQDVALLSPILTHWGLLLEVDLDESPDVRTVRAGEVDIPVGLPGHLSATANDCGVSAEETLAECRIGKGGVVVLADAAVLDTYHPHEAAPAALEWLLQRSFSDSGEIAGSRASRPAP